MEASVLFFLTSGLFLGWALGANDAASVFGTAVTTRMIRFSTATVLCSVFVILGAVSGGGGAAETLGRLGAVDAPAGSFMAALAAGLSVYLMNRCGLPVSATQAIVGGIIGWNLFTGTPTDSRVLLKIIATWAICPLLAAVFSAGLYLATRWAVSLFKPHLLRLDAYTRVGLVLAGAFGSYSLGANNIANVMGVFVPATPFHALELGGWFSFSGTQQLFLLGSIAIAAGVVTHSGRVMSTVGKGIFPLSPISAWVVVVSHSLVLFLFSSQGLERFLVAQGLPTIPLVPVSSTQAVVGAVLGIALLQGRHNIRWRVLGKIGVGWMMTPILAGLICFIGLFFLQNVFDQPVQRAGVHRAAAIFAPPPGRPAMDWKIPPRPGQRPGQRPGMAARIAPRP